MRPSAERLIKNITTCRRPADVLTALQTVSVKHSSGLKVYGAWFVPRRAYRYDERRIGRCVFFHPKFPGKEFWAQYQKLVKKHGASMLGEYGRTRSHPFTLTEAMRDLQLAGEARWPFDLLSQFGIRDGLYCPFRRWVVMYYAAHPLQIERSDRYVLGMAANVAIERMEQLVKISRRSKQDYGLTDREKIVLRLLAQGRRAAEIAAQLQLSQSTVRTYVRRILKRLKARTIAHAVHIAGGDLLDNQ